MDRRHIVIRIPRLDGYKTLAFNIAVVLFGWANLAVLYYMGGPWLLDWFGCWLVVAIGAVGVGLRLVTDRPAFDPAANPHRVGANRLDYDSAVPPIHDFPKNFSQNFSDFQPENLPRNFSQNFSNFQPENLPKNFSGSFDPYRREKTVLETEQAELVRIPQSFADDELQKIYEREHPRVPTVSVFPESRLTKKKHLRAEDLPDDEDTERDNADDEAELPPRLDSASGIG